MLKQHHQQHVHVLFLFMFFRHFNPHCPSSHLVTRIVQPPIPLHPHIHMHWVWWGCLWCNRLCNPWPPHKPAVPLLVLLDHVLGANPQPCHPMPPDHPTMPGVVGASTQTGQHTPLMPCHQHPSTTLAPAVALGQPHHTNPTMCSA